MWIALTKQTQDTHHDWFEPFIVGSCLTSWYLLTINVIYGPRHNRRSYMKLLAEYFTSSKLNKLRTKPSFVRKAN